MLDRPTEGGGEGPPALLGPGGNPPFIGPFAPPEYGGEASWPCSYIGLLPRGGIDFGYEPSFSIPEGQMVPDVDTGDNGGLARAASIVCNAETGRGCQGGGGRQEGGSWVSKSTRTGNAGKSNDYASVVAAGNSKGSRSSETTIVRWGSQPSGRRAGPMFARGERQAVNRGSTHSSGSVGEEKTGRQACSYPHTPNVPASALQKSTGRFVTCVQEIRDV